MKLTKLLRSAKKLGISTVLMLSVLAAGTSWLLAQNRAATTAAPTIAAPTITPNTIVASTSTDVRVSVQIADPRLLPGGVNLLRLRPAGTQATIVGVMHDDGIGEDAKANDQIFTLAFPLNEPNAGQIQLQVSAAFKSQLRRTFSSIATLEIWNSSENSSMGVRVQYPPTLTLVTLPNVTDFEQLSTSPLPLLVTGGRLPEDFDPTKTSTEGYAIGIQKLSLSTPFSLDGWLNQNRPYSILAVRRPVLVSGFEGEWIEFQDEVNAGEPIVFVPVGSTTVFVLSYVSSLDQDSSINQMGLNTFNQILDSISLF